MLADKISKFQSFKAKFSLRVLSDRIYWLSWTNHEIDEYQKVDLKLASVTSKKLNLGHHF